MDNKEIIIKTITINKENFLNVYNPDQQIENTSTGTLSFNTGIYGNKTDDAFPDLCIDLYINGAAAHQNLVNLKAGLILGNNLQAEDDSNEATLTPFISHRNKSGDNLKAVYGKLSQDMALFNAGVMQVVYNREGQIAEVYHVGCQNFRYGKPNKYGQIEFGYLSPNWANIANSRASKGVKDFVKIRMFDPTAWKKYPVQLMYCKSYGYTHYAIPSYTSAINWILISREIADFHKNNIRSNFFLGGMLTQKKGGMSDDQIAENAAAIEQVYKGGQGRKVLLSYVEDLINDAPKFEKFQGDDQDKLFDILNQQAFQSIVTAHNAYTILAGSDSKGSDLGGDSNKLITNLSAFNYLVAENMKTILVGNINRIMEVNELPPIVVITEMPKITIPVQQPEDLTVNERREMIFGLPEIDNSENNVAPTEEIPTV